jgi:uncharacterized alkaline shock family protein YloU
MGVDIPELAALLRQKITDAVRSSTGLEVNCVDIHVASVRDDLPALKRDQTDPTSEAARRFSFDEAERPE